MAMALDLAMAMAMALAMANYFCRGLKMKTKKRSFTFSVPSIGITQTVRTCTRRYDAWIKVCHDWNLNPHIEHTLIDSRVLK